MRLYSSIRLPLSYTVINHNVHNQPLGKFVETPDMLTKLLCQMSETIAAMVLVSDGANVLFSGLQQHVPA